MHIAHDQEQMDWMGSNCWFCGKNPPAQGKSCHVRMKKFADGAGNNINVLRSSVAVPRCETCAAGHNSASSMAITVTLGGSFVVFLIVVVWSPIEMEGWLKGVLVFLGLLPGATMLGGSSGLPEGQKPESAAESFMAVEAMRRGGWMKDDQP